MSTNRDRSGIDRLLEGMTAAMRAADLFTPVVARIFDIFKKGNNEGKTPEAMNEEAMGYVNSIIGKADKQLAVKPDAE